MQQLESADNCTRYAPMNELRKLGIKRKAAKILVSQARFELTTFPLGGGCSIQLSYWDETAAAC